MNFTRQDCLIPLIEDQPTDEAGQLAMAQKWIGAIRHFAEIDRKDEVNQFAAKGWAFAWFSKYDGPESEAIEEALNVIEQYYPRILERGLNHSEDMGLLLSGGRGQSEGIMIKMAPYDRTLVLIEVCCVTGPTNFDPIHGIEFELGSKSHKFHLLYRTAWSDPTRIKPDDIRLPDIDTLMGDICIYPLLENPINRLLDKSGKRYIWQSEGWVSKRKLYAHISWKFWEKSLKKANGIT